MTDDPLVGMGPQLRGASPPFSPTGKAATAASNVRFVAGGKPLRQSGHTGILAHWRAAPGAAASLLPWPLEPIAETDTPSVFLNQTQTGQGRQFLLHENPQLSNWHEVLFLIPCSFQGRRCSFVSILYKDVDYDAGIQLGIYRGFVNKAAQFATIFPFEGQPLNRMMAPGAVARFVATRMGEKIVDCSFVAERELSLAEIDSEIDRELLLNDIGIRYLPDWSTPDGPPLVHDLVLWGMTAGAVPRAVAGQADLRFGDSEAEELDILQPVEMLPSHFIDLQYRGGPGVVQVLHDYVERRHEGDRIVRRQTSDMGPTLRGASPPFTPTGKSAFARSTDLGGGDASEIAQAGHVGILARWRCDRTAAERLLPAPLEPSADTDKPYLFLNRTQTGLNIFREPGKTGLEHVRSLNPYHVGWHEALFMIPCLCEGKPSVWVQFLYKDCDHGVVLGMFDGFWTKLATFHATFPFRPQPENSVMEPGGIARYHVSRFDERLVTCEFRCERELPAHEIAGEINLDELLRDVGVRYWPDYARPGEAPLAHDLIIWKMGTGAIPRAWRGEISLEFGTSDYEELHPLAPIETLPSHFIYLEYGAGPGLCHVVHDYVARPLA